MFVLNCYFLLVKQQITTTEKGIELNSEKIAELEGDILKKETTISELKQKINEYETFLVKLKIF